jgi:23S rRNA pseudouridine2605 synthase
VGRLDKESEGLMILTNDGDLAQKLTHPSYEHEKEYLVTVKDEKPLSTVL